MNKIVNTFLLGGDKFMSKLHLKQSGFISTACGLLLSILKKFKNSKEHVI